MVFNILYKLISSDPFNIKHLFEKLKFVDYIFVTLFKLIKTSFFLKKFFTFIL